MRTRSRVVHDAEWMSSLAQSLVTSLQRSIGTPPVPLTFAQPVPGTEQEHSKVIGGNLENITHLVGAEAFHLAQREREADDRDCVALIYANVALTRLPGPGAARGALYGLAPWLVAQIVVIPMMGMGLFSGSMLLAGGSLIGHLVYGVVVGGVAGVPTGVTTSEHPSLHPVATN